MKPLPKPGAGTASTGPPDPPARWWNSLRVRLVVMMSLALLPIGLIAISQTRSVSDKERRNAELALLAQVEQAALTERLAIQRAFGAAESIAAVAAETDQSSADCSQWLRTIVERSERFSFAGLLQKSGMMTCSSADRDFDFSERPGMAERMVNPRPVIQILPRPEISKTSVINVSVPYFVSDRVAGRVSISVPHSALKTPLDVMSSDALLNLVTFNSAGEILTETDDDPGLEQNLPMGLSMATLAEPTARAFTVENRLGESRIYTIVPVQIGQLYILGIWDAKRGQAEQIGYRFPPILFPALIWLTSLLIVLMAIHRLVSRHVRGLRGQMVRFARDRTLPEPGGNSANMPTELLDMQTSFTTMAYSILRDEANLENAVREKNVLIREIHHRVKNNLQLISSILNMQIRESNDPETRTILRRVQDRVLSLATIHRDLYQSNRAGLVNVGALIAEIIEKSVEIGTQNNDTVRLDTRIDDIFLYPDQAVPMSLLAAEAATNAMKYVGTTPGHGRWIKAEFLRGEDKTCVFRFANSTGQPAESDSTGMGAKLIKAFAIQLGAEIEVAHDAESYVMTVTFETADFIAQADSY